MVDIQSATAEIRRGIKKERRRKKKETTGQKYNGLPYSIGRPYTYLNTKWHRDPSSRFVKKEMDQEVGGCCVPCFIFFGGGQWLPNITQCRSVEAYTKRHLDPSICLATADVGGKLGGRLCPFSGVAGSRLKQCGWGRGLPLRQVSLWSPYVIGQTIIFLPCGFYLLSFFFPRLILAVGDWMSTILPHMVWP